MSDYEPPKKNYWKRAVIEPQTYWLTLAIMLSEGFTEDELYAFWYVTLQKAWPEHFKRERPLFKLDWLDEELGQRDE